MRMDTPDNYYTILGVPIDADSDTLKRAYRQLARRYHPDLAGPEGALQMKRINRAYDVLSDPQKRMNYDTVIGGVIDLRTGGLTRTRPKQQRTSPADDLEFSGLSIFATKGPLHTGPVLHSTLGVISALHSVQTEQGMLVAAGTLDGTGMLWHIGSTEDPIRFATDPTFTTESLRELRFSAGCRLLAGWGRLGLHVWDTHDGKLLWSYSLGQRAVSAHYSLDVVLQETASNSGNVAGGEARMALPFLSEDPRAPRAQGVRATDIVSQPIGVDAVDPRFIVGLPLAGTRGSNSLAGTRGKPLVCAEDQGAKRQFWAIRLRSLAQDAHTLLTLSCANTPNKPGEPNEMIIIRRWDLTAQTRFGKKPQPRIMSSMIADNCAECTPPYAVTPRVDTLAFVHAGHKVRLYDTVAGTYSELPSGTIGASSKLAISPNARWIAVAREDSEVNEGVIDLWSVNAGQLVQKLYHPWQISALHFAEHQLLVALTDGTIQVWHRRDPIYRVRGVGEFLTSI
jgi:DnaJ domain